MMHSRTGLFLAAAVSGLGAVGCSEAGGNSQHAQPILQIRLAQANEVAPAIAASDPTGSAWARRYEENFPVKVARACGVSRFDVASGTDFFQAVHVPISAADEALFECLTTRGEGHLRLSIVRPESH